MAKRYQKRVVFWLNLNDAIQNQLYEYIQELKEMRMFAPSIRDAILLRRDLCNGRLCELERQFPGAIAQIKSDSGEPDSDNEMRELTKMLTQVVLSQSKGVVLSSAPVEIPASDLITTSTERPGADETADAFMADRGNLFS